MKHRRLATATSVLGMLLAAVSVAANAAGEAARGAELATSCMGCHGIAGYRNAYPSYRVPKLGGQNPGYLVLAMQAYRARTRPHPTMEAQMAALSDADMQDIAAFFASQGQLQAGDAGSGGTAATRGRQKASVCAACHGETGTSAGAAWPSLAGQHRDYLEHAIAGYKAKLRQDPVMQGQAMLLSDQDIKDLAAFYSAQPGLFTIRD
jgi:cytochrome c553